MNRITFTALIGLGMVAAANVVAASWPTITDGNKHHMLTYYAEGNLLNGASTEERKAFLEEIKKVSSPNGCDTDPTTMTCKTYRRADMLIHSLKPSDNY